MIQDAAGVLHLVVRLGKRLELAPVAAHLSQRPCGIAGRLTLVVVVGVVEAMARGGREAARRGSSEAGNVRMHETDKGHL